MITQRSAAGQRVLLDRRAAAIAGPGRGRHAGPLRDQLGEMLVVAEAAEDRAAADISKAMLVAEQRDHHLAIEEPAAIEQREDEIHVRLLEQDIILVGELTRLRPSDSSVARTSMMIDGVIAVLGVHAAAPKGMLRHEQDFEALFRLGGNALRGYRTDHVPVFRFRWMLPQSIRSRCCARLARNNAANRAGDVEQNRAGEG